MKVELVAITRYLFKVRCHLAAQWELYANGLLA